MQRRYPAIGLALVAVGSLSACGGGSTSAAVTTSAPALSVASTCESWQMADATTQRALAESRATSGGPAAFIETVNSACTPARRALTIGEAVRIDTAPPPDPYAATRVKAAFRREISESILKSWNECGPNDVCITGERGLNVSCDQPDPQVSVLSCFVTTDKGTGGDSDYGYPVKATVKSDGSYTWSIDRS